MSRVGGVARPLTSSRERRHSAVGKWHMPANINQKMYHGGIVSHQLSAKQCRLWSAGWRCRGAGRGGNKAVSFYVSIAMRDNAGKASKRRMKARRHVLYSPLPYRPRYY